MWSVGKDTQQDWVTSGGAGSGTGRDQPLIRVPLLVRLSLQVDAFIAHSAAAGIDVFTNFDAHNDLRNHGPVAEAVHKAGRHYQAALSWAVCHSDPAIYNVQWAVQWFRDIVKNLDPHSLYVKVSMRHPPAFEQFVE